MTSMHQVWQLIYGMVNLSISEFLLKIFPNKPVDAEKSDLHGVQDSMAKH